MLAQKVTGLFGAKLMEMLVQFVRLHSPFLPQFGQLLLQGRVALQGGVWIPASDAVPENVVAASDTVADVTSVKPDRWILWLVVAVVLVIGGVWWLRRRRS